MSVEEILSRLQGARSNGVGWFARCPAHGDKNPSLSIHERDSKILIHCHAGCTVEAICTALGIEMRDLFADGMPSSPRIIAEYPYNDERGTVLFEVVRFEPKGFRQRRPDGKGGWIWGVNGTRRVLYRLPELLTVKSVLIVEGEKDVESARSLDLVATCNPGGAGKWRDEYSEVLRGKCVAVIADADEPGRKHARAVAASLFGKAGSLKIVELPGSKDLTEWLEAGGTKGALHDWIDATPEWVPATEEAPGTSSRRGRVVSMPANFPEQIKWPDSLAQEAFHGLAGEIVGAIEPHSEADPAALLIQLLVATGNAIGRGPFFTVEQHQHHVNLFTVIVGLTSKARKGTSWSRIAALLGTVDSFWTENRVHGGVASGEGIVWHVRDPILKGDTLIDDGIQDKRLLLMESEFAQPLAVIERQGNTTSEILRRAWDGTPLQTLTKNNSARATGAHISMIGHVTRDELLRHLSQTEIANGLANRFIFCCAKRSKTLPEGSDLDHAQMSPLAEKLRAAVAFARDTGELERNPEARRMWAREYPELSEGKPGLLGAVSSRAEAQVLRLSMVYALLDCSAKIRCEHLQGALAVWRYAESSCRYIFGDALGDPVADEILRALRAKLDGLTRSEIRDVFRRHRSEAEICRALATLLQYRLANFCTRETGGRPVERWFAQVPAATKAT